MNCSKGESRSKRPFRGHEGRLALVPYKRPCRVEAKSITRDRAAGGLKVCTAASYERGECCSISAETIKALFLSVRTTAAASCFTPARSEFTFPLSLARNVPTFCTYVHLCAPLPFRRRGGALINRSNDLFLSPSGRREKRREEKVWPR